MNKIWREYGLIGLLIFAAVGGYFLLGEEREDILNASLDALGQRLTELVDGGEAKAQTADQFEAFREAVAANDISPEDVERIAASVLNLSKSGAKLTPEDVNLVLDFPTEGTAGVLPTPGTVPPVPVTPTRPPPPGAATNGAAPSGSADLSRRSGAWSARAAERVGSRVAAMVELTDRLKQASEKDAGRLTQHYRFIVQNGLQVVVDSVVAEIWQDPDMRSLAQNLEREKVVVWDRNLDEVRQKSAEQLAATRHRLALERAPGDTLPPEELQRMKAFEQLNRLQELGLVIDGDSTVIRVQIDRLVRQALRDIGRKVNAETGSGTDPGENPR